MKLKGARCCVLVSYCVEFCLFLVCVWIRSTCEELKPPLSNFFHFISRYGGLIRSFAARAGIRLRPKGLPIQNMAPEPNSVEDRSAVQEARLTQALARVSAQIDERQFQIFDLYVIKDWPSGRVAKRLGVSVARVYLSKHRVGALVRKEVRRLEKASEEALQKPA